MQKQKDYSAARVSGRDGSNFVPGEHRAADAPKKTISGIWPFLIIWGLLLLVLFMGWLKTT